MCEGYETYYRKSQLGLLYMGRERSLFICNILLVVSMMLQVDRWKNRAPWQLIFCIYIWLFLGKYAQVQLWIIKMLKMHNNTSKLNLTMYKKDGESVIHRTDDLMFFRSPNWKTFALLWKMVKTSWMTKTFDAKVNLGQNFASTIFRNPLRRRGKLFHCDFNPEIFFSWCVILGREGSSSLQWLDKQVVLYVKRNGGRWYNRGNNNHTAVVL